MECLDCSFSHYYSGTSPTLGSGEDLSNLVYSKIMGMAPSVNPCSQIALTLGQQSSPCVLPSPSHTVRRRYRSPLLPEPANFLPPSLGESLLSTLPSHLSPALSGSPIIISLMSSGYHYSQGKGLSPNNSCWKASQRTSLESDMEAGKTVQQINRTVSILSDSSTEVKLKVVLQHQ